MLKVLGKAGHGGELREVLPRLGIAIIGGLIAYVFLSGLVAHMDGTGASMRPKGKLDMAPRRPSGSGSDICRWRGCWLVGQSPGELGFEPASSSLSTGYLMSRSRAMARVSGCCCG